MCHGKYWQFSCKVMANLNLSFFICNVTASLNLKIGCIMQCPKLQFSWQPFHLPSHAEYMNTPIACISLIYMAQATMRNQQIRIDLNNGGRFFIIIPSRSWD